MLLACQVSNLLLDITDLISDTFGQRDIPIEPTRPQVSRCRNAHVYRFPRCGPASLEHRVSPNGVDDARHRDTENIVPSTRQDAHCRRTSRENISSDKAQKSAPKRRKSISKAKRNMVWFEQFGLTENGMCSI